MPQTVFLAPLPRMRLMLPEPLRLLADLLASASNRWAILPVHLRVLLSPRPVAMANDPTRARQTRAATTLSSSQPLLPARKGPAAGAPLFLLLRFVSKPAPALLCLCLALSRPTPPSFACKRNALLNKDVAQQRREAPGKASRISRTGSCTLRPLPSKDVMLPAADRQLVLGEMLFPDVDFSPNLRQCANHG